MSHKTLQDGVVEIMKREDAKKQSLSATELILDGSNKIAFPGFPFLFEALNKKIIVSIDVFKSGYECKKCKGTGHLGSIEAANYAVCTECRGRGAILIMPDISKNLPTTGVVVSIGNRVPSAKLNYKIGDRVLFGAYAGNMIPTKSGLLFKIIDWNQCWARIEGAEELGAFDFILQDEHSS